jgi:hypothetical protein
LNRYVDGTVYAPDDLHPGGTANVTPCVSDAIVDEVRAIREAYAESLGNDPAAIVADLCSRQARHPQRLVSLAPRPVDK